MTHKRATGRCNLVSVFSLAFAFSTLERTAKSGGGGDDEPVGSCSRRLKSCKLRVRERIPHRAAAHERRLDRKRSEGLSVAQAQISASRCKSLTKLIEGYRKYNNSNSDNKFAVFVGLSNGSSALQDYDLRRL